MPDWLDSIPNLNPCPFSDVPSVPSVPGSANPQKSAVSGGTPARNTMSAQVFQGVPVNLAEKPGNPPFSRMEHREHVEHTADDEARAILRDWHGKLSRLDVFSPPDGFTPGRWADLCDDACWLYETHASQLVRERWSALDIFGVSLRRENGEVLLDRLYGARNLRLNGEGRAYWSRHGVTFITSRGAAPPGMLAVWDFQK